MWLTFAPVPSYAAGYYNISESDVDWFSMAYFVVSLVMGFFSIYVLDTFGLKVSVSGLIPVSDERREQRLSQSVHAVVVVCVV